MAFCISRATRDLCHKNDKLKNIELKSTALIFTKSLFIGGLSASVAAGDTDLFSMSLEDLLNIQVVTTPSMYEQSIQSTPVSTTIITAQQINEQGYRTLSDLLAAQRSFYVAYDRNYSYVGVRGYARPGDFNSRVLIMINGQRINDNYYDSGFIGREFPLSMQAIERVEIVRGPNSSVYGSNALLAVVNVVTRNNDNTKEVRLTAGRFNTYSTEAFISKALDSEQQLTVSLSTYHSDGDDFVYYPEFDSPSTNNGVYQNNDGDFANKLFLKYTQRAFSFSAFYSKRIKDIPTASYGTLFNAQGTEVKDIKIHWDATLLHDFNNDIAMTWTFYGDRYDYSGDYVYDYPPVTINRENTRVDTLGAKGVISHQINSHHLMYGVEHRRDHSFQYENFDVEPYFLYEQNRGSQHFSALFFQDEFASGNHWLWTLGARLDKYSNFDTSFNPRLSVQYNTTDDSSWKLLATRAFRIPSLSDRSVTGDLNAETVKSVELVYEKLLTKNSNLMTTVFYNQIDNLISFRFDEDLGETTAFNSKSNVNSRGFELEYRYQMKNQLILSASYGYISAQSNNELVTANSPQHLLKSNVLMPVFDGFWNIGLNAQYLSERKTVFGDWAKAYFLTNMTISSTDDFSEKWQLSASLYNIFDKQYADPASINHTQTTIPQDGRSLYLQANYRL
ncbi:iron complex outermembrane receptor protein [Pleionea mediterranea]|uniref:Iron complex outermembrane receptor protein n=1 Tax=Pleionea mediterranea TaxID=523701 RepID=A0A316G286_9GAMM|nr:iron complex outermembrane receptor protein [Pleionea mediterranea]